MNNSPAAILFDTDGKPVLHSDSFGRLKVANPTTLFDGSNLTANAHLYYTDGYVLDGYTQLLQDSPIVRLHVGSQSGSRAVRQTRQRFNYQAGKSQVCMTSFCFGSPKTNLIRRVGYFANYNGIFLEQRGDGLRIVRRTSTSGTPSDNSYVLQADWNVDTLDGYGPSGISLDVTKSQIIYIELQWLGVGTVRVGFNINGQILICHEFHYANQGDGVYMANPALPVRYEILNDGATAGPSFMDSICATVISEGGNPDKGITCAIDRGITPKVFTTGLGTALRPLLQVRLTSDAFHAMAMPEDISVHCTTVSQSFRWVLFLNPTFADNGVSTNFQQVHPHAIFEADTSNSSTVTGGYPIASGYGYGDAIINTVDYNMIPLGMTWDNVRDVYCLAIQPLSATNENFIGAIRMRGIT